MIRILSDCFGVRGAAIAMALAAWTVLAGPAGAAFHSDELPYPERTVRIGFWLGISNNETFTPEVTEWLGERCSFLVIRGSEQGIDPYFDFTACVARFKKDFPDLPVLHYDQVHAQRASGRIDGQNQEDYEKHPEWMLKSRDGSPMGSERTPVVLRADLTNPEFRRYIADLHAGLVKRYGSDGVAFDLFKATLANQRGPAPDYLEEKEKVWLPACADQLALVRSAINAPAVGGGERKYLLYNGLWTLWPGLIEKQAALLPNADAACVEYFARNVKVPEGIENEEADFDEMVLDILKPMMANPDKVYAVYARSPRYVYLGYEQDYDIQRYGLACFLLGMTPKALYKYHSHFQGGYAPPGRTYGMSYYEDYDIDMGEPAGAMEEKGGVYLRRFTKGLAAVAPMHRGDKTLALDRRYYTPEGEAREGTLSLKEGHGALLLTYEPPEPPKRVFVEDFEDGDATAWRIPVRDEETQVVAEGDGRFLRLRLSKDSLYPFHERRIQPIRSRTAWNRLSFRIRGEDKGGAVLVRVEVDDATPEPPVEKRWSKGRTFAKDEPRAPYCVLVVRPEDGTFAFSAVDKDIPYGHGGFEKGMKTAPFFPCPTSYRADGTWQTVSVDLSAALKQVAPHLTPRRVPEMRVVGEADLDDIVLER